MRTLRMPRQADWQTFYSLASREGWKVPQAERELLLHRWQAGARLLEVEGAFAGLVTTVAHQWSGWIGNLIVPEPLRGRGYGVSLFQEALSLLEKGDLSSVWLTASEAGRSIYEKAGFLAVDQVERWVLAPRALLGQQVEAGGPGESGEELLREQDRKAWGETRASLLDALLGQGEVFFCDDAAALLQKASDLQIIGPWYSETACPRANRILLQKLLASVEPETETLADVLVSSPLRQLLAAAAFQCTGRTLLMVKGDHDKVDLKRMVSLASLGSFG